MLTSYYYLIALPLWNRQQPSFLFSEFMAKLHFDNSINLYATIQGLLLELNANDQSLLFVFLHNAQLFFLLKLYQ